MNLEELNKYQKKLDISIDKIIREEAEMIFLDKLANDDFGTKIIFYGGTALRLAYNSPRYSEDIDLILNKTAKYIEFENFLRKIIKENNNWKLKDIKDKRNTWFGLVNVSDKKLKHNFSLKIEIRKPKEKLKLKTELLLIKSPVSILSPLLLVPTLNELKNLKIAAILDRKKARDIFDLWYIAKLQRKNFIFDYKIANYTKRHFKNELQVFLPKKYYKIIEQLYEQINSKTK
ncbi:nucleotidyl transferase AbiEii/AbiGii toxin family protein [Candidatus Parcubacteria bacterium]|nr:nucleotidyl transferase AbiEii/AbiGii toxin family protein [Candidatus Parcubacteria bacterium]